MAEISPELDAMAVELIGVGAELLEAGDLPAVLLATNCEPDAIEFADDDPDGCYRAAREQVATYKDACERYALLYPGVVAGEQGAAAADALIIEFAERGMECAFSGYMPYQQDAQGRVTLGDPLPAGEEELLFG